MEKIKQKRMTYQYNEQANVQDVTNGQIKIQTSIYLQVYCIAIIIFLFDFPHTTYLQMSVF